MGADETTFLLNAYARMLLIRQLEEQALQLTRAAPPVITGSIHICTGQEAIPVGARAALRADDRVVATYRGHGWAIESGVSPFELLAEMAHRQGGINGGRAGSLLAMAPHRGFIGENSIVGAGGPIACGVGIAATVQKSGRVVVVSFGDGATSQGGLHEAFVTAAVLKLPVIFVCENNGWAEMTPASYCLQPGALQKRAQGYGMAGAEIDGCDVSAVRDAVAQAAARARAGEGPTLIEALAVRLAGHYNRDIQHYRSNADKLRATERDPIERVRRLLILRGTAEQTLREVAADVTGRINEAVEQTLAAQHPDTSTKRHHVFAPMPAAPPRPQEASKVCLSYAQAVRQALIDEMVARPEVVLFGEDVAKAGGIFGVTRELLTKFGPQRVFDTPIAETAILGSAVGAAMDGLRPVAEIMFADFLFVALDQLINQAAKMRYISNNLTGVPLVIRTQQGVTPGSCAQHAQCVEAFLAHVPGLKVGLPITPADAYSMLRAAIADPDPCVIIEARSALQQTGDVFVGGGSESAAGAHLMRQGGDVALISWGTAVPTCLAAAAALADLGIAASVLNLRWLSPLDHSAIEEVTRVCGRVLIVHEANTTGGFGAEIAAVIAGRHAGYLKAPVMRLGAIDVPMPAAPGLQQSIIPTCADIVRAVTELASEQARERTGGEGEPSSDHDSVGRAVSLTE